ncbi:hypothetical protein HQ520_14440 [bacterium]|nr:hypothetical protein [bacterium]
MREPYPDANSSGSRWQIRLGTVLFWSQVAVALVFGVGLAYIGLARERYPLPASLSLVSLLAGVVLIGWQALRLAAWRYRERRQGLCDRALKATLGLNSRRDPSGRGRTRGPALAHAFNSL